VSTLLLIRRRVSHAFVREDPLIEPDQAPIRLSEGLEEASSEHDRRDTVPSEILSVFPQSTPDSIPHDLGDVEFEWYYPRL
jgi:hypothetical protein